MSDQGRKTQDFDGSAWAWGTWPFGLRVTVKCHSRQTHDLLLQGMAREAKFQTLDGADHDEEMNTM